MNKFQTHQTKPNICKNYLEVADGHLLAVEDQLLLKVLKPRLDQLLREPSEDVLCTILAYTELL